MRMIKLFAIGSLCLLLNAQAAPAAYSTSFDFGSVGVGDTSTTTVTIYNTSNDAVEVKNFAFMSDGCPDFSIISLIQSMQIPAGGNLAIDVGYTPSAVGECSNELRVWTDSPIPNTVAFSGRGVANQTLLADKIQEILAVMDSFAKGNGPGQSADNRLNAIRHMIQTVAGLIEDGQNQAAYNKLSAIYQKMDGIAKPKDFIQGGSAQRIYSTNTLAGLIQELMTLLKSDTTRTGKKG